MGFRINLFEEGLEVWPNVAKASSRVAKEVMARIGAGVVSERVHRVGDELARVIERRDRKLFGDGTGFLLGDLRCP